MKKVTFSSVAEDGSTTELTCYNVMDWVSLVGTFQQFLNGSGFIVPMTDIDFASVLEEAWEKRDG